MNETHSITSSMRRVVLPLLVAVILVVGTVIVAGSDLIRYEDAMLNRILAGTYGTPDWRVQDMNPLLAQLLTLFYRIMPSVNWYGVLLLALLALSAAAAISLTARRPGGLLPAIIIVSPIVVLLTGSVLSTAVCALCAVTGALSLMDGLQRKKDGVARAILGAVLFLFAAMLSLPWTVLLAVCALLCWLPCALRDSRMRGLLVALPLMAVLAVALYGYSSLMYNSPELSSYRENYARYERLQHSSLKVESDELLAEYGTSIYSEEHSDDHSAEVSTTDTNYTTQEALDIVKSAQEEAATATEPETRPNSFDKVGWTINDASLFFTRYSADSGLTDPDTLKALEEEASYWDFTPSRLLGELLATVKKPQFLLLIGLFVLSALAVLITSRRRGLMVLLAAIVAFGGHILTLAHYYDTFADIAPFYLLGIGILLYFFNGEDAKAWLKRVVTAPWLRGVLYFLTLAIFVGAMGGLLYYTRVTPANYSEFTVDAVNFLKPYIAEHKEMLFVGENPNERYKPGALEVPVRGEDENLLAGSYDLYSPRRAALMEQYAVTNPLPDSIGRDDIGYVVMGFTDPVSYRLVTAYDIYAKEPTVLFEYPNYAESIISLQAFTAEEVEALRASSQENLDKMIEVLEQMQELEEQGLWSPERETEDDHDHDEDLEGDVHQEETTPTLPPSPTAASNG